MQLSPRELERLTLFSAAELARRRIREGIPLSHPDCVALASDVVLEAARGGASYEEASQAARGLVTPDQLAPGVAELLATPLQVEATFGDGSRLVELDGLVAGRDGNGSAESDSAIVPGEIVLGTGDPPAITSGARTSVVTVTNRGRLPAFLTSHFQLAGASRLLEFEREGLAGARPHLPSGASVEIPAGESRDIEVIWD